MSAILRQPPCKTSLTFAATATSDRVNHGTGVATDPTVFCAYAWVFPIQNAADLMIFGQTAGSSVGKLYLAQNSNHRYYCTVDYATDPTCQTVFGTVRPYEWQFVGVSFDGATAPRIFIGSRTTPVCEASYESRTNLSGGRVTDSGAAFVVGNRTTPNTLAWRGRIGLVHFINGSEMDAGGFEEHRREVKLHPNSKLLTYYGQNHTGSQTDLSGNGNHGTITGAIFAEGMPVISRRVYFVPPAPPASGGGSNMRRLRDIMDGGAMNGGNY